MARKKKTKDIEKVEVTEIDVNKLTDDFFINLTMSVDKRDDLLYPKWAIWCAKSGDKYYIDVKDGYFFTNKRNNTQIAIKRKRNSLDEFLMRQEYDNDAEMKMRNEYESYVNEMITDDEKILEANPMTYKEWLTKK